MQSEKPLERKDCPHASSKPLVKVTIENDWSEKTDWGMVCLGCIQEQCGELVNNAGVLWVWDKAETEVVVRHKKRGTMISQGN
jgi:hypothetical protein